MQVKYQYVADDKATPAFLRLLAMDLMKQTYMMPGEFFKNISDADLQYIIDVLEKQKIAAEKNDVENEALTKEMKNVFLLSIMLANAEGGVDVNEDTSVELLNITAMFAIMESLSRKGLVDLSHNELSYIDLDKGIAKPKF